MGFPRVGVWAWREGTVQVGRWVRWLTDGGVVGSVSPQSLAWPRRAWRVARRGPVAKLKLACPRDQWAARPALKAGEGRTVAP